MLCWCCSNKQEFCLRHYWQDGCRWQWGGLGEQRYLDFDDCSMIFGFVIYLAMRNWDVTIPSLFSLLYSPWFVTLTLNSTHLSIGDPVQQWHLGPCNLMIQVSTDNNLQHYSFFPSSGRNLSQICNREHCHHCICVDKLYLPPDFARWWLWTCWTKLSFLPFSRLCRVLKCRIFITPALYHPHPP